MTRPHTTSLGRLPPLTDAEMGPDQLAVLRPILARTPHQNVYRTFARNLPLFRQWGAFARYILTESTLEARDRELAVMRIAWLCQSPYEWAQHVPLARAAGLTDDLIEKIKTGSTASGWTPADALLLQAVESLHETHDLPESIWSALAVRLDERQLLDLVFTIGQYHLVAMALNAIRVPVDPGLEAY